MSFPPLHSEDKPQVLGDHEDVTYMPRPCTLHATPCRVTREMQSILTIKTVPTTITLYP